MTLIGVLSRLPRLRKLVLHNTHLEMDVLPFLALALGNTQALAELDLTGNYIGAEQMAPLMAHAPAALVITL
jgi:Ran GTPase-activating protein (RanGAP) involved in mRNA processing and transport